MKFIKATKIKKSVIFIFITLLFPFTANAYVDESRQEYNWTSKTSITTSDNYFTNAGEHVNAGVATKYSSIDYYVLIGKNGTEKLSTYTYDTAKQTIYPILIIEKSSPTTGILIEDLTINYSGEKITIGNPNNLGPEPLRKITTGQIVGKAIQIDPGSWKSSFEGNIVGKRVSLYTDNGTKIEDREIYKEGDNYFYHSFTLKDINNKTGLYPGRYRLKFNEDQGASCSTGNAQAEGDVSQLACHVYFEGIVNFDILTNSTVQLANNQETEENTFSGTRDLSSLNKKDGINIGITQRLTSPMDQALEKMIEWAGELVNKALGWSMQWVDNLLTHTKDYVLAPNIQNAWTRMRDIGLTLLVLALMIIAFANVLQLDIERYGLNRIIPKIIIAIVMSIFSWGIVFFFFDFTAAIQAQAMALMSEINGPNSLGNIGISIANPTAGDILLKFSSWILLILIAGGALVAAVVLVFTLTLRIVMLSFLLAVAPLAFIFSIMPFTENLYKQWWSNFWKWMFMGPISLVIIALGVVLASSVGEGYVNNAGQFVLKADMIESGTQGGVVIISVLILAASLYMGATLPLKWGGGIMKGWSNFGKKAWGKTGGALGRAGWNATGGRLSNMNKNFWSGRKAMNESRDKQLVEQMRAKVAQKGTLGGIVAGSRGAFTNKDVADAQAKNLRMAAVNSKSQQFGLNDQKDEELKDLINRTNDDFLKEAAIMTLVNRGQLDTDPNSQALFDKYARSNGALISAAMGNQRELMLSSSIQSNFEKAMGKNNGIELKEMGGGEIGKIVELAATSEEAYERLEKDQKDRVDWARGRISQINKEQVARAATQAGAKKYLGKLASNDSAMSYFTKETLAALSENIPENLQEELSRVNEEIARRNPVATGNEAITVGQDGAPGGFRGEGEDD